VAALSQLDPRVPPLGRFVKHWATRRRINNRSEGTLSTYTLILQLFYFLQTRSPPVLPRVADLLRAPEGPAEEPARAVNALASAPEMDAASGELRQLPFLAEPREIGERFRAGRNAESLGELLHGFFQLWGQEAFRGGDEGFGQTVYVYDATCERNDLGVLVVRCPLTGKNVNPFTAIVWRAPREISVRRRGSIPPVGKHPSIPSLA